MYTQQGRNALNTIATGTQLIMYKATQTLIVRQYLQPREHVT